MIKIQKKLDRNVTVACSGGVDSMAIVDFLSRSHHVTIAYVNHGTDHGHECDLFMRDYKSRHDVGLLTYRITEDKPVNLSQEEFWRNERYKFFHQIREPVITAHHLDDCVETWIWSSLHGEGKIIPYANRNVIRPFRLNRKQVFYDWCEKYNVPYLEDPSNLDNKYMRNLIRNQMMPFVLKVNPGIHKVIRKKVLLEA